MNNKLYDFFSAYSHPIFANTGVEKLRVIAIDNQHDNLLSDVEIGVFSAEPSRHHGTTSLYEQSHFIKSTVLELEVPRNVPLIVTSRKSGYLPESVSITLRTDQGTKTNFRSKGRVGALAFAIREVADSRTVGFSYGIRHVFIVIQ